MVSNFPDFTLNWSLIADPVSPFNNSLSRGLNLVPFISLFQIYFPRDVNIEATNYQSAIKLLCFDVDFSITPSSPILFILNFRIIGWIVL